MAARAVVGWEMAAAMVAAGVMGLSQEALASQKEYLSHPLGI